MRPSGAAYCAAISCSNCKKKTSCKDKTFHKFPIDDSLLCKKWLVNVRRANYKPSRSSVICSDHFEDSCFVYQNFTGMRQIKRGSIPTKFSFPSQNTKIKKLESSSKKYDSFGHHEDKIIDEETPLEIKMQNMLSNVEIKARISDIQEFLKKARDLSETEEVLLKQKDTYFRVPEGRLKLREIEGSPSQLVFYKRPNILGPKLSNYYKQDFQNVMEAAGLTEVLKQSLGTVGIVSKERHLFMVGCTRIHVDNVKNIGCFMELEVMLEKHQTPEYGQSVAEDLMSKLGVSQEDLLEGSYIDMIFQNPSENFS